jgi:archaellum component FlaF (FlaF/FlaG flagellin family)
VNVVISTAILMITTIIAASIFAGAALSQLYSFQNTLKDVSSRNQELFGSSVAIIGEARSASSTAVIVWVKNVGRTSFSLSGATANATYWDLFITFPNETYTRVTYNSDCQSGCWNAQILNDKGTIGVWEYGETLQITIYTGSTPAGSYAIRLTLPNSLTTEDKFSLG